MHFFLLRSPIVVVIFNLKICKKRVVKHIFIWLLTTFFMTWIQFILYKAFNFKRFFKGRNRQNLFNNQRLSQRGGLAQPILHIAVFYMLIHPTTDINSGVTFSCNCFNRSSNADCFLVSSFSEESSFLKVVSNLSKSLNGERNENNSSSSKSLWDKIKLCLSSFRMSCTKIKSVTV